MAGRLRPPQRLQERQRPGERQRQCQPAPRPGTFPRALSGLSTGVRFEPPWRSGARGGGSFPDALVGLPVRDAARALLGAVLESSIGGRVVSGVIVETEAYEGPDDPASHASTRHGPTERNRAMWGPPGHAYVYRSYGVHWCMNVVTGEVGHPQAVLIRGLDPLEGEGVMLERREGRRPLAAGPGRVCMALGITDRLYGHDLRHAPLLLRAGWSVDDASVGVSARVGVSKAADWPYRFFVRGSAGVSPRRDLG